MKHTQGEVQSTGTELIKWGNGERYTISIAEFGKADDCKRAEALWNAAKDMTTEEAVRYLKHGREMEAIFKMLAGSAKFARNTPRFADRVLEILTKLNKGG